MSDSGKMEYMISNGSDILTLPVNPSEFEINDEWNNEEVNINSLGLVTLIGKRGLRSVTLSSFFPGQNYPFLDSPKLKSAMSAARLNPETGEVETTGIVGEVVNPWTYVKKLSGWKGKVLRLTITGTNNYVTWQCVINNFKYGHKDGTTDVYYTLELKEYKTLTRKKNTKTSSNVVSSAAIQRAGVYLVSRVKYTTKKNDTLKKIAIKQTGKSSYAKKIYKENKKAVKKGFKKYMKKLSKKKKKKYKKQAKINRKLPKGVKLVINP